MRNEALKHKRLIFHVFRPGLSPTICRSVSIAMVTVSCAFLLVTLEKLKSCVAFVCY